MTPFGPGIEAAARPKPVPTSATVATAASTNRMRRPRGRGAVVSGVLVMGSPWSGRAVPAGAAVGVGADQECSAGSVIPLRCGPSAIPCGMADFERVVRTAFAGRRFTDEAVTDEDIGAILDIARFASSGGNQQGWRV